ncbi:MAG: membrane protein insertase YidC [Phycisphaerae bacterium]
MHKDTFRNLLIAVAIFCGVMLVGPMLVRPPRPAGDAAQRSGDGGADHRGMDSSAATAGRGDVTAPPGTGSTEAAAAPGGARAPAVAVTSADAGPASAGLDVAASDRVVTLDLGAAPPVDDGGSFARRDATETGTDASSDPYRIHVRVSNLGGGAIESATTTDHREHVTGDERYRLLDVVEASDGSRFRSLAVDKIDVDGVNIALRRQPWHVVDPGVTAFAGAEASGERVAFSVDVTKEGRPILRLTRTWTLPKQARATGRHDLRSDLVVENLSDVAHDVAVTYRGGIGVRRINTRMDERAIDVGIRTGDRLVVTRKHHRDITKSADGTLSLYKRAGSASGEVFSWGATQNTYFTCTVAPLAPDRTTDARNLASVTAIDADGDEGTIDDTVLVFGTVVEPLAPGARRAYPVDVYLGDKDPQAFKTVAPYVARDYYQQISQDFGFCTFTFLVEFMVWLLALLHGVVADYGVSIIILVLIVRALLHPITKKGQVSMVQAQQRMGELQPRMEEIKRKYANDRARQQQEQMKLFKETGVNPASNFLGCVPMALQMPIWIALYISLSHNIGMRHEPFFYGLTWINDLTTPDKLYTFAKPFKLPLLGEIPSFNLMPFLLAVSMYTQQKLMPKPKPNPNMSEQQRQQQATMQAMMPMMSIMMLFIFYKMPSGLNIYIMASSLFGALEQAHIRKHIREQEEAGALDARHAKKTAGPLRRLLAGLRKPQWVQQLQKAAEDAQKLQRSKPRR